MLDTHNPTRGKDSYVTLHVSLIRPKETVKTSSVHRQPRTIGHNKILLFFPVGNVRFFFFEMLVLTGQKHTGQNHVVLLASVPIKTCYVTSALQ